MNPIKSRSILSVLIVLFASSAFGEIRCWKPHPYVHLARYWVEIRPTASRTGLLQLEFGTGTEDGMTDIRFTEEVHPPTDGIYRTDAANTTDLEFAPARNGRFELRLRERSSGKKPYRMKGFSCSGDLRS